MTSRARLPYTTLIYPAPPFQVDAPMDVPAAIAKATVATAAVAVAAAAAAAATEPAAAAAAVAEPVAAAGGAVADNPGLLSTKPLSDVEIKLHLPSHRSGADLLRLLEQGLSNRWHRLQRPTFSESEAEDVRDAQQATSDASLKERLLRCDGVEVNCVPVSRSHFARLRHHNDPRVSSYQELYFSDELVDAWAQCLRRTEAQAAAGDGVFMWSSGSVYKFFGYRTQPPIVDGVRRVALRCQRDGIHLLRQRAWVLPRVRSLHWDTVLVDFRSKQIIFVDSMGSSNETVVRRTCTVLEVVSWALDGRPFDFRDWVCGSLGVESPQQPDGHNCGLMVLLLARCVHHDVKITRRWSGRQLDEQRDIVALELMEAELCTFVG